jgi:hypothetical protein
MIDAEQAVVWISTDTHEVMVWPRALGHPSERRGGPHAGHWADPIGAAYSQWREMSDDHRVQLMMETAIDLAMRRFDLGHILREFSKVKQFRALGSQSYPMARALTSALLGKCLEPNTMNFEDLLTAYAE